MTLNSSSPAAAQILEEAGFRDLPLDWKIVRIGDLLADERGISVGVMYPGQHDPTGIPLLRSGDLFGDVINPHPEFRITRQKHDEYRRTELEGGELLISLVGDLGRCAVVPPEMRGWNVARAIAVLRFAHESDAMFVCFCLRSPQLQHLMSVWATTTVQATLNLKEIKQIPIPLPSPEERARIVAMLDLLGKRLEVNSRINETLEGMGCALFKAWFVNFDPVRDKTNGGNSRLTKTLADLFPDSLTDSDLGQIPLTWSVRKLGDLIELAYGKALKEENRRPGRVAVYGSNGQVGWHDEKLANAPGVIVGRKGNPGVVTWASTDFFAIDTTFYVVPKGECKSLYFLYYALRAHDLASLGADSAVPGLNRNMVYMSQQLVPSTPVLDAFDHRVRPIFERIQIANDQSSSLSALRDTLLPKLISGELRLPDAERIVGGQM